MCPNLKNYYKYMYMYTHELCQLSYLDVCPTCSTMYMTAQICTQKDHTYMYYDIDSILTVFWSAEDSGSQQTWSSWQTLPVVCSREENSVSLTYNVMYIHVHVYTWKIKEKTARERKEECRCIHLLLSNLLNCLTSAGHFSICLCQSTVQSWEKKNVSYTTICICWLKT